MSYVPVLLAITVVLGFAAWRALTSYLTPKPLKGIPHNAHAVKPFGDIPELVKYGKEHGNVLPFFAEMYRRHGPICQVLLGPRRMILVSDYGAIHEICDLQTPKIFDRDQMSMDALGHIFRHGMIALPANDMFRAHRRALAPAISSTTLSRFQPNAITAARQMLELWRLKLERYGDKPFSIKRDCLFSLNDVVGLNVFGASFESVDCLLTYLNKSPTSHTVNSRGAYDDLEPVDLPERLVSANYLSERSGRALSAPFPKLTMLLERHKPMWGRSKRLIRTMIRQRLAEARAAVAARGDAEERSTCVLDMLVEKEAAGGLRIDNDEDLIDEMHILLLGGSESTGIALMWCLKWLSRNADVQKKLRAYLAEKLPSADFTFEDVTSDRTPYLEAVIHECLRLSPVTGGGVRDALCDTNILGYDIPKGSFVLASNCASTVEEEPDHPYDAEAERKRRGCGYWKRGTLTDFSPERWLRDDGSFDGKAGPMFIFASGPRACWGRPMAISQLRTYIALINRAYFLDALPAELNRNNATLQLFNLPEDAFIRPKSWKEVA